MPLEEAQRVISEYVPEKPKEESLPKETKELYEQIQAISKASGREITMDEYLKLKYPEAEDEELRTDNIRDQHGLEDAMKIDTGCATCKNPDTCWLPNGYKTGGMRPHAVLKADARGRKHIEVRYGGCIRCKHGEDKQKQIDPEFEARLKKSGLTEIQAHQTFEHHEHTNVSPEIVIAKAQAMLAVQNETSLILAGKAGTGKTHLAIAIAIETMRRGRQALFRNVPELLDELRERARNYDDFYHTMRKYKDVPCLVLDDLGKEKTTQAGLDYLYQIIDARYRNGRQTIVTTNALSIQDLTNRWNEGVMEPLISRILENGEYVRICEGENRRLKKPQRLPEEKSAPMAVSVRVEESRSLREILPDNATPQERCQNLREILEYRHKHGEFPPEYERLELSDKVLLQRQLMAEYIAAQEKRAKSYVPDDGLDDDEEDLTLYGDTGLPNRR
jgi:DNA replication protein DnaC